MAELKPRYNEIEAEEMERSGFPKFVTDPDDRDRLEEQAAPQLATWRREVTAHHVMTNVNDKLRHRATLERAWKDLKNAWQHLDRSKNVMYNVKSKSSGSYFGRYKTKDAAQADADAANGEEKYGKSDWEPEEVAEKAFRVTEDDDGAWMVEDGRMCLRFFTKPEADDFKRRLDSGDAGAKAKWLQDADMKGIKKTDELDPEVEMALKTLRRALANKTIDPREVPVGTQVRIFTGEVGTIDHYTGAFPNTLIWVKMDADGRLVRLPKWEVTVA